MIFFKRLCALVLTCCLVSGCACAQGLTDVLDGYLDLNDDVQYAMSAQIDTLTPYGDEMLSMLNAVLKHLSIGAVVSEDTATMDVCVDGESVMSMTENAVDGGTELTTPLLPNRTLTSAGSAFEKLGSAEAETAKFDLFSAISEWEDCYQALTDAILPYAEEKSANYKITDVATSKWSRIARLTPEQGAEIAPLIEKVLGCGMDEAFRETLVGLTPGKGFIVGLYQLKEGGPDLALYMKGYLTFADGKTRNLAFQWAFTEKEGVRIDTVKYELVRSKTAVDTREIHATLKRQADDTLLLKGDCTATIKDADGNITTVHTYDLSGKEKDGVRPVSGTYSIVTKVREGETTKTETTAITPDVKLTSADGSGVISGSVKLEQLKGKVTHASLTLLFDDEPAELLNNGAFFVVKDAPVAMPESSLSQNIETDKPEDYLVGEPPIGIADYRSPETMQVIDLDTTDQMDALMQELSQNLAGRLLIALAKIPEEDAALIRDNLSEEDYAAFLSMVDSL